MKNAKNNLIVRLSSSCILGAADTAALPAVSGVLGIRMAWQFVTATEISCYPWLSL